MSDRRFPDSWLTPSRSKARRVRKPALSLEHLEDRATPATLWVDNTPGSAGTEFTATGGTQPASVPGLTPGVTIFTTISAAVAAATPGDVINVSDGTYSELVDVNKTLTLQGNQFGVPATTRTGANETVVNGALVGSDRTSAFLVRADNVVLDGFTAQDQTDPNQFGVGIVLSSGSSGTDVLNNIIQNNVIGLSLANDDPNNPAVISGNLFRNNNNPGPASGTGIYTDDSVAGGTLTGVLIDSNRFEGHTISGIEFSSVNPGAPATAITVTSNQFVGNENAIAAFALTNSTITRNTITTSTGSQLFFGGAASGVTITQNFIENGAARGIRIDDFIGGSPNQNFTITRNSIQNNAAAGLEIVAGGYTGPLNAELNWWGSPTGPTNPANPGGTGEELVNGDADTVVDFVPFLTTGVDTQPGIPGFQPVVVNLRVVKVDSPDPVAAGNAVTYTITVTNSVNTNPADPANPTNGNADLDTAVGAVVQDVFSANHFSSVSYTSTATGGATGNTAGPALGNINDQVTLPPNSTIVYTVTATVRPDVPNASQVTNTATVTGSPDWTELAAADNADTETTNVVTSADLSVTKTDSVDPVTAGQNLTYTITLTNAGPSDAQAVSLTDAIPAGTTFVSFTAPGGWTPATPQPGQTGQVSATTATVPAQSFAVFTLVVNVSANTPQGATVTNTATASTGTTDPNSLNDSDTEATAVNAQADLSVTKADSADPVTAGQNITYTISIANTGPSDAQNVQVTDTVPANTTFAAASFPTASGGNVQLNGNTVVYTFPTVAAGATVVATLVVTVNGNTPNGTTITNTASGTTTTTDPNGANNSDTETTNVVTSADLAVTKADTPDPVVAGTNLTYTLTVANAGASDAQNVTLTDTLPAGTTFVSLASPQGWTATTPAAGGTGTVTATIPTLAAGSAAQVFTLVVSVGPNTPQGATVSNTASVSSATGDANPGNNSATVTTAVNAQADLSVTKADTPDPATAGTNVTYTITVASAGPSDAQNVTLTDALPAGTTFVSLASPPGWTATTPAAGGTGTVTATIPTLTAGSAAQVFTLVVNVSPGTASGATLNNTATVTTTTTDTVAGNNSAATTTTVATSADVSAAKTGPATLTPGTNATYTITVANTGPSDAQTVSVTDVLPAGTTFVSASQTSGPAFTLTAPPAGQAGTVAWNAPVLPAAATATFTLVVAVNPNVANGTTTSNTATVTSPTDTTPGNNASTATATVAASADLAVTKADSPDPAVTGQNLTYTITVTTAGPGDAQAVQLTDAIPAGTTFVSLTAPAGWATTTPAAGGTGTVTATRPTLAAGTAPQVFTLVVNVNQNLAANTTISNTVAVSSTTTDANPGNNQATATTSAGATADLQVTKSDSPDPVFVNGLVTYTIVVTNAGTSDAQAVTLTDAVPARTSFVSFTAPAGWATTTPAADGTGTITAAIPALAAGSGPQVFTLVVRVNGGTPANTSLPNTATVSSATTDPIPGNNAATAATRVAGAILPIVVGAGSGAPHVKVFDPVTRAERFSFYAYNPRLFGEVRVAAGDVNGDGVADIITGTGPGAAPHVKVFDGRNLAELFSFYAYSPAFVGGVYVGAGDVDGDGFADILTGAGPGAGSHVKVFSGRTGGELHSFFAYPGFSGGATVAAGDLDGDGRAEIITGAASGGSAHVKVFDPVTLATRVSIFAFDTLIRGGAFVAAGDLDGDGISEFIAGNGDEYTEVKVFTFDGLTGDTRGSLFAYNTDVARTGTRVAVADRFADGKLDILTGPGPGQPPTIRVFDGPTLGLLDEFAAFGPGMTGGVYVG